MALQFSLLVLSISLVCEAMARSSKLSPADIINRRITKNINKMDKGKGITFPLIPHHEIVRRRQRRLQFFQRNARNHNVTELNSAAHQMGSLYQGYGTHYLDLWVGTPPQRQTLIVDTGSSLTAFPCENCTNCGEGFHIDSYFEESKSSTFQKLSCGECTWRGDCNAHYGCVLSTNYVEGSSWTAYESLDYVYFGGPHGHPVISSMPPLDGADPNSAAWYKFRLNFGCQTAVTGPFRTQLADGIMGLNNVPGSFWDQMYTEGVISKKQFAICIDQSSFVNNMNQAAIAGAITLGGLDARLHPTGTPMVFAKNVKESGYFSLHLKNLYLRTDTKDLYDEELKYDHNEKIVKVLDISQNILEKVNRLGIMLDSGSTDTYLSHYLEPSFADAWQKVTGKEFVWTSTSSSNPNSKPFASFATAKEIENLPTILFQLQVANPAAIDDDLVLQNRPPQGLTGKNIDPSSPKDVLIAMPPTHYMQINSQTGHYESTLFFNSGSGSESWSTLGSNFMQGHNVFFDVENDQIGFAQSDCNYASVVNLLGKEKNDSEKKKWVSYGSNAHERGDGKRSESIGGDGCHASLGCTFLQVYGLAGILFIGIVSWSLSLDRLHLFFSSLKTFIRSKCTYKTKNKTEDGNLHVVKGNQESHELI